MGETVRTKSGRALDELTIEAVLAGELTVADFRISAETLRRQADSAKAAGYRQLAENLRRAAEFAHYFAHQLWQAPSAAPPRRIVRPTGTPSLVSASFGRRGRFRLCGSLYGYGYAPIEPDLVYEVMRIIRSGDLESQAKVTGIH